MRQLDVNAVMKLDVDQIAALRQRGSARRRPWQLEFVREISREDLVILAGPMDPDKPQAPLARIRSSHHVLAQMIAEGKSKVAASAITGYSTSRIATLTNDPAFQELVDYYQTESVYAKPDVAAQIQHIALAAGQELLERLEEDPTVFSNEELRKMMADSHDRSGNGPSAQVKVTTNTAAQLIQEAHKLIAAEGRTNIVPKATIIDATYTESSHGSVQTTQGSQPDNSGDDE